LRDDAKEMSFTAWSTLPSLFALLLVGSEYLGRFSSRAPRTPKLPAGLWIAALIASYATQLAIVWYTAVHEHTWVPWRASMPLAVVDAPGAEILHGNILAAVMLLLGAAQSYALLAVYRSHPARMAVQAGCALMLLLSCFSPGLLTFDLYFCVHDALLGFGAYRPPTTPFPGEYHLLDLFLGGPAPTLYGPLWLVVVHIMTSVAPTLLGKLMALRFFDAGYFIAILFGLRALGMPARIRNVAALNPGFMLQYISNGHNDLLAIVVLVWAAACVRKCPALAFGLIAAAGLIKLPYAILGLPILTIVRPLPVRIAGTAGALAVVGALSWAAGGAGYGNALGSHVHDFHPDFAQHAAGAVAVALVALSWFRSRRLQSAVWIMPTLSAALYSWYFVWGLPYALGRRRIIGYLLVCFPFVTMLIGSAYDRIWELNLVLPVVVAVSILAYYKPRSKRLRRDGREPVPT
jgi:hypothetical protein